MSFDEPCGSTWGRSSRWAPHSDPNGWTNRKGELGYPIIFKELLDNGLIRLGGPFGRILLQQFEAFNNKFHLLSNGDEQVINCVYNVGHTWTTPKWCKWGDEERRHLWKMAKANVEKVHKWYKDFVDKYRQEVNFEKIDEVWLNIKNFRLPEGLRHKFLGPYTGPFKVLEKINKLTFTNYNY